MSCIWPVFGNIKWVQISLKIWFLIWRVQLLNANVFFSCSLLVPWKILLFIPYAIFKSWYLLCFQCNVPSHGWKTKAQMKRSQMKKEWKTCAKITDEDGMKDMGKNHDFKILFDRQFKVKIKKTHSFHNKCIKKEYQN